jgi:hypothetical protein
MTASDRPFADFTDQQLADYSGDIDNWAANPDRNEAAVRTGERLVAEVNARRGKT